MIEEWKQLPETEYQVSNTGKIRRNGKVLKPYTNNRGKGYMCVALCKNGVRKRITVHRLVAQSFIENPYNLEQVNHKDGNTKNNSVDNLEWVSNRENTQHAYNTGLNSKVVKVQVVDTETKEVTEYPTSRQASMALGYSASWLYWAFKNKGDSFKLQTKLIRKAGENHVSRV